MAMINWLHITDWHVGQSEQNCRWPNFRDEFEKDLSTLIAKAGPIDIVFFSGDLVQSGTKEEFEVLEQRLSKLWVLLRDSGSDPKLVIVPGNHDLVRPESTNPTALALSSWAQNESVEKAFWESKKAELRDAVNSWFAPLSDWMSKTSIPLLAPTYEGKLVGDALYLFEKPNIRLGILGLNSTFLQFRGGNLEGLLALSPKQIPEIPNSDYAAFLDECHVRVLMTHHPYEWLSKQSQDAFLTDIWPSSRFDLHLCGHKHAPTSSSTSNGGSGKRQIYQGASFFGLEKFENASGIERIHGYALGVWRVENNIIKETYWPRVAHKKHDRAYGLVADPASYLTNDSLERTWENRLLTKSPSDQSTTAKPAKQAFDADLTEMSISDAQNALKKFPQLPQGEVSHHWAIRSDERALLQSTLQNNGVAFLVSDWGLGKDEFLSTCFYSENQPDPPRVFVLRCDAFSSVAEIEVGFKHQFGVPLHTFLNITSVVGTKCLILDGVQPAITQGAYRDEFSRLCGVIRDFALNTKLLLTGRMPPGGGPTEIQLKPLETLETRAYVEAHPLKQQDLLSTEAIERLHYASGGLPTQIDRLLERLQVASLSAVLDEESELRSTADVSDAALSHCIRMLDLEGESRAGMLLRALVILPFGETIEGVKRFFNAYPLFPTHAKILQDLALIEIIPVHQSSQSVSTTIQSNSSGGTSPKILRVPKQVRACVLAGMNPEERDRYLSAAGEFIFGANWRVGGKIKLRKVPPEYRDYVNSGLGNEYAVVSALLSHALTTGNVDDVKIAVRLGLHYCGVLKAADRNRDLRMVSSDLIRQLDGLGYEHELVELHALCGHAHRLTGEYGEAAKHFELSLDSTTPKPRKESTGYKMLGLASALNGSGAKEKAMQVVDQAQSSVKAGTLLCSQLEAKKAVLVGGSTEYESLVRIESQARSKGWISHANDTALNLVHRESDNTKKLLWLSKVLTSSEGGWNLYRAVVDKARLVSSSKTFDSLSFQDRVNLRTAYAFCHAQRLEMFDSCHRCLWQLFEAEGNISHLYSLFRSSSFIWRLRGDEKIELEYYKRLSEIESGAPEELKKSTFKIEIEYFAKRAKILILRIVGN